MWKTLIEAVAWTIVVFFIGALIVTIVEYNTIEDCISTTQLIEECKNLWVR